MSAAVQLLCDCGETVVMHEDQGKGECLLPGCGCRFFTQKVIVGVDWGRPGTDETRAVLVDLSKPGVIGPLDLGHIEVHDMGMQPAKIKNQEESHE